MEFSRIGSSEVVHPRVRGWLVAGLFVALVFAATVTSRLGYLAVRVVEDQSRAADLLAAELQELKVVPWTVLTDVRLTAPERLSIFPPGAAGVPEFWAYRSVRGDPGERYVEIEVAVEWIDAWDGPCRIVQTERIERAAHQAALLAFLTDGKLRAQ